MARGIIISFLIWLTATTAAASITDTVSSDTVTTYTDSTATNSEELFSLGYDIDSLLNLWYAKNYLYIDSACESWDPGPVDDSIIADRLANLPTIIEMPFNSEVRNAINQYTVKYRKTSSYMLGMFNMYDDIITGALMKNDVPLELKYLPVIESALRPDAYSRAGAAGLWQFVYGTGRTYGLSINSLVDDRMDIWRASDAAARHLRDLYDIFHDWTMAVAAYNCGPGNMNKAIIRSGGKSSYWDVRQYLPRETRSYIPLLIAVTYTMHYYRDHGICPMQTAITPMTDTLMITQNLHINQITYFTGLTKETVRSLNPQYLTDVIPGRYRPCVLTLPTHEIRLLLEAGDSLYSYRREELFPSAREKVIDDEMNNRRTYITHRIIQGETLSSIAIKYHTSVRNIKSWNNMTSDNIRAGRTLKIYNR